jgi:hypothetical protein
MTTIREATIDEIAEFDAPGYETWMCVAEEDGKVVGRLRLSRHPGLGQVFGHDFECDSSDPYAAVRMYKMGKAQARKWGQPHFFIHVDEESNSRSVQFWQDMGAKAVIVVLKVPL